MPESIAVAVNSYCWRSSLNILRLSLLLFCFILTACGDAPWNSPYPKNETQKNSRFNSFAAAPKTLDPAKSYSNDETSIIGQIYEPPLQYHFLRRPYTLVPLTAAQMPNLTYLDKEGRVLPPSASDDQVAYSVYTITIKPGIYFQPHPAFAHDAQGNYKYHGLARHILERYKKVSDFKTVGSRELTAADYIYEIKRFAKPGINSPIYGLMATKIVGLDRYAHQLTQIAKTLNGRFLDLRHYPLAGVQEVSRYQYKVIIKGKYPQFLYWLSMPFFAPIPWEADLFYSQPGMENNSINFDWYPVGTGPYFLSKNDPNSQMILKRNPLFHPEFFPTQGNAADVKAGYLKNAGQRLPFLDSVILTLEKESIPRWNKFLQGYYDQSAISSDSFDQAIQMDRNGNPYLTPTLKKQGVFLQTTVSLSTSYIGFNMLDEVVGGYTERARKLRLAITLAIDFDEYISIFLNGRGIPAQGPLPPGIFGYQTGIAGINPYIYEWHNNMLKRKPITVARQLMREAGYPNGIDPKTSEPLILNYDVTSTSGPEEKSLLDWMREQFAKIGIQLNIRATEYNRFQEKIRTGQGQIFMWAWIADYPDPENFLFLLYGPNSKAISGGENTTNYKNQTYDDLFNKMKNLPDTPERQNIINAMLAIVRKDAPWVWGVNPKTFVLSHIWNQPAKISDINYNTLKYQKVDPSLRERLQIRWNKRVTWPLLLLGLIIILITLPVIARYLQKERKSIKTKE